MKTLLSAIFILTTITVASAAGTEPCTGQCQKLLEGLPGNEGIGTLEKTGRQLANHTPDTEKLESLASKICSKYKLKGSTMSGGIKSLIIGYMTTHASYTSTENKDIVRFLNENKDYMTCGLDKKNYMMIAFDNGAHNELFRQLFAKDLYEKTDPEHTKVDINAIAYVGQNGAPITVLDYIDMVLLDPRRSGDYKEEVLRVKSMFTKHFGAKRFHELPGDVQQAYLDKQAAHFNALPEYVQEKMRYCKPVIRNICSFTYN